MTRKRCSLCRRFSSKGVPSSSLEQFESFNMTCTVNQIVNQRIIRVKKRKGCDIVFPAFIASKIFNNCFQPLFVGVLIAAKRNQFSDIIYQICVHIFLLCPIRLHLTQGSNRIGNHMVDKHFTPMPEKWG